MAASVDVIVPCYRYGHFLRACVDSVLAQQGVELRVLVIDDASPDDSAAVAEQLKRDDARVEVRHHARNAGHIATYNEGIAWARASYLTIVSADDLLLPGALARTTALMASDGEIGFGFGEAQELWPDLPPRDAPTGIGGGARVIEGSDFIEMCARRGCINFVPTPTVVVRTALQQRVGGYRPELPHSGDLELWLRLAVHGSVAYVPEAQAIYRRHAANMSLGYDGVADLLQRQAAVECFCRECAPFLQWMPGLRQRLLQPLGREAVKHANAAFNAGEAERMQRLLALARTLHPGVESEFAWFALACKRRIGERAWRALAPALHRLRGAVSRLAA